MTHSESSYFFYGTNPGGPPGLLFVGGLIVPPGGRIGGRGLTGGLEKGGGGPGKNGELGGDHQKFILAPVSQ
jgi:hypothetical protein